MVFDKTDKYVASPRVRWHEIHGKELDDVCDGVSIAVQLEEHINVSVEHRLCFNTSKWKAGSPPIIRDDQMICGRDRPRFCDQHVVAIPGF